MNNKKPLNGPCFESSEKPEKLVFLLHGYGDNAENFIPLATHLYDPGLNINFYAPNAPSFIPQYPIGRQWFDLYPNGINFNEAGSAEKEILKQDCLSSLNLIKDYINNLCIKYKLTHKDCFIIGFSQGAMMAFEFGKYINNTFAGCVLLSGRILSFENNEKENFVKTPMMTIVTIVTKKMLQVEKMRGRWDIIEFSSGGLSASTPMLSFKRLSLET